MEYFENDPIRDLAQAIDYGEGMAYARRLGEKHIEVTTDKGQRLLLHVVENYR